MKWVESFLTNRTQSVVVDGTFSLLALIISGVPQGTVLGPILFLIFINDIEHCIIHSIVRCFADDTRISIAVKSELDVQLLQSDLENVMRWSERNNMALHRDKLEYMCHASNKRHVLSKLPFVSECYQYQVSNDITLQPVNQLRDLGVLVSKDLSCSGETLLCAAPPLIAICRPYLEPARFARQNLSVEIPFYLAQI